MCTCLGADRLASEPCDASVSRSSGLLRTMTNSKGPGHGHHLLLVSALVGGTPVPDCVAWDERGGGGDVGPCPVCPHHG